MRSGYAVANGIRIFYVEEGEGPLVLMCHGWPESWYSWRHQIEPIAAAGFRAVAVDLPGYGRSDKPDVVYDIVWLNACLSGLIEALGHDEAILAGHDWGGLLVWPFARMYPEQTAGVIGLNTPDLPRTPAPPVQMMRESENSRTAYIVAFQERGQIESVIEADVEGFLRSVFLGPATVHKEVFTDEVIATYAEDFRPKGAMTPPLEYYRNMDRDWELTADLADVTIEVPCLMISAESDPVLTPGMADGMEARVSNLERVVVEDCGHWTQQEQPDATNDHMLRYLKTFGG